MKKDGKNKQLGYNVGKRTGIIGSARFRYLIADYNNDEALIHSMSNPVIVCGARYK
jgi:hypothetical protein